MSGIRNLLRYQLLMAGVDNVYPNPYDMTRWLDPLILTGESRVLITGPSGVGKTFLAHRLRRIYQNCHNIEVPVISLDKYSYRRGEQHLLRLSTIPTIQPVFYEGWSDNLLKWAIDNITHVIFPYPNILGFRKTNHLKSREAQGQPWAHETWVQYWARNSAIKPYEFHEMMVEGVRFIRRALHDKPFVVVYNYINLDAITQGWYGY